MMANGTTSKIVNRIIIVSCIFILFAKQAFPENSNLKMYGFFDMEAEVTTKDDAGKRWTFDQHHLNIISVYTIDRKSHLFSEVEWEHGPAHSGSESVGKIYLARGYLEYKLNKYFIIRTGKFMTPFGIYNERHDATPTFLSTKLPHVVYDKHELASGIKGRLYAKHSTGLQVLGKLYQKQWELKYQLYLSNGRGKNPSETDDNANKGIGYRFIVTTPIEDLKIGASYYRDKNGLDSNSEHTTHAFDLELDKNAIHLEAEILFAKVEKIDQNGIPNNTYREIFGYYIQPSISIFDRLEPFVRYEFNDHDTDENNINEQLFAFGINYSVTPSIFLKSEIHFHGLAKNDPNDFLMFISSVAVVF